jgi:hypothetical protein
MDFGKVDQGRAVSYDKDKHMVTIIRDKKIDTQNPDYSYLPPLTYVLPTDPIETGPEPKAGGGSSSTRRRTRSLSSIPRPRTSRPSISRWSKRRRGWVPGTRRSRARASR